MPPFLTLSCVRADQLAVSIRLISRAEQEARGGKECEGRPSSATGETRSGALPRCSLAPYDCTTNPSLRRVCVHTMLRSAARRVSQRGIGAARRACSSQEAPPLWPPAGSVGGPVYPVPPEQLPWRWRSETEARERDAQGRAVAPRVGALRLSLPLLHCSHAHSGRRGFSFLSAAVRPALGGSRQRRERNDARHGSEHICFRRARNTQTGAPLRSVLCSGASARAGRGGLRCSAAGACTALL